MERNFPPCEVCKLPGNGVHFGVDACRGCTSFFRRTVIQKRTYFCNEDESCNIGSTPRSSCRKCRFEKCLSAGMKKELIQTNRDIYGKRSEALKVAALTPSPSVSFRHFPVPSLLLKAIGNNYAQLESIRIVVHHEGNSIFKKHESKSVNYVQVNRLMQKEFKLVSDWVSSSFPQLSDFEPDQKDILIRNFYMKFYILECGFIAVQKGRNNVFFLPSGDYIDCQNLATYYTDPEGKEPITPEQAAQMFGGCCASFRRNVTGPMLTEKVDRFEFLAMATLVLFDTGIEGQSDECMDTCSKIRQTVQREMLQYYSTRQVFEFCIRMGNLLTILPNLQRSADKMFTDFELAKVMKCYTPENDFVDTCISVNTNKGYSEFFEFLNR